MDKGKFVEEIESELKTVAKEYDCEYTLSNLQVNIIRCDDENIGNVSFFYSEPIEIEDNDYIVQIKKLDYRFIVENSIIQSVIKTIDERVVHYKFSKVFSTSLSHKINLANSIIERTLNDIVSNSISLINELSISKYENSTCTGYLFFSNSKKSSSILINENKPIEFNKNNLKMIRKLLVATRRNNIVLNVRKKELSVKGFDKIDELSHNKGDFIIEFLGSGHWKMFNLASKNKKEFIIEYRDGKYYGLSTYKEKNRISKEKIEKFLKKHFDIINVSNCFKLIELIQNNGHGAIIVITDDKNYITSMYDYERTIIAQCSLEQKLFYKEHQTINEKDNILELIAAICDIDGAVFINSDGELEAFGTILDGIVQSKGETSRGSRYNSTKTFIETKIDENNKENHVQNNYLAVVISEDGPINVFTTDDEISQDI